MGSPPLKHGSVTLYAQLANVLRDRIYSGVWAEGQPIPTLDQLSDEFDVKVTGQTINNWLTAIEAAA